MNTERWTDQEVSDYAERLLAEQLTDARRQWVAQLLAAGLGNRLSAIGIRRGFTRVVAQVAAEEMARADELAGAGEGAGDVTLAQMVARSPQRPQIEELVRLYRLREMPGDRT